MEGQGRPLRCGIDLDTHPSSVEEFSSVFNDVEQSTHAAMRGLCTRTTRPTPHAMVTSMSANGGTISCCRGTAVNSPILGYTRLISIEMLTRFSCALAATLCAEHATRTVSTFEYHVKPFIAGLK